MPAISKIRFTNVVYEDGNKRYNDELFQFDGHNGAILLENGGGKTVFIQTAIQAVLPHTDLAGRKIKDTLRLENGPAHIAIEWILHERPRRYVVTCVSLFLSGTGIDSYRYVYDYSALDDDGIDRIPFVKGSGERLRAADKGEIYDYYHGMTQKRMNARLLPTIKEYKQVLEKDFHIIASEWERIVKINGSEGGVENFFEECRTTNQLFDRLLIPTVEDAMSGYEQGEFADSFEAHRDGFKKYKELKEKVDENQKILAELDRYVRAFAKLEVKQKEYAASQSEAKAYWQLSGTQKSEETIRLHQLRGHLQKCEEKLHQLAQKKDSLHIALQKQDLSVQEEKLRLAQEDAERLEEQLQQTKRRYYSLRLAEYKQQWKQADERIKYVSRELEQLGSTQEEAELQEAWVRNSGHIRSLFLQLEAGWQAEEERLKQEAELQQERKRKEETVHGELAAQIGDLQKCVTANESTMAAREKDRDELRKGLLAQPSAESVEASLPGWIQRHQKLDESCVQLVQKNKEWVAAKEADRQELEKTGEALKQEYVEQRSLEEKLGAFRQSHQTMLAELAVYRSAWERLSSVYDKQSSIEGQLAGDVEKLRREKEEALHKERLAFRYIDDYAELDTFFADKYADELLNRWKNQFSLLQTGIQYVQSVGQTGRAAIHPLWAVTWVTTEQEVAALSDKLRQQAEHLQFPIQIVSVQEASRLVTQEAPSAGDQAWIEPKHWRENADRDAFARWKKAMHETGSEIQATRKDKERELQRALDMQSALLRFLAAYPLEAVQELESQVAHQRELVRQHEELADQLKKRIHQTEQDMELHTKTIGEQKDEMLQLQQRIEKGQRYLELAKEINGLRLANEQLREQAASLQSKLNSHQRSIQHIAAAIQSIQEERSRITLERTSLHAQELYADVADAEPIPGEMSLEWLRNERRDLHLKLNRISQGRQQLEEKLASAKAAKAALDKEMSMLRQERADLHLSEDMEFPATGEEQMKELLQLQREQEEKALRAKADFRRTERQHDEQKAKIGHLIEQYAKDHPDQQPMVFFQPLLTVQEQLAAEDKQLQAEQQGLQQQNTQILAQLGKIEDVIQYLNPYTLIHGFENPQIPALPLTPEAQSAYGYDRMNIVKRIMAKLILDMEALQAEDKAVKKAKSQFLEFCRKQIKDVKLREMTEQGVELRDSYTEIAAFQQTMRTRIERVNHIAEESMRTHNLQLEQFIVYVHGHLKLIASELRDIPNKTKVKVDDQWKPIFSFLIPEWEETEAKSAIRAHVEWILGELDKEKYRDDSGQEFKATVRKDIEKWLDTKQLLQIVLKERPMKVSCRKVTNENNVTKASFSWEQSNNWSGGEKWSKNMTLFLGLLNYVAEKRQHIQAHMKRHRTVIMDNPFGKASSDHVLSPVFFIAEQLGFQIIALTAHAEGKFLKDYFPVVFSCRLRQAAGSSKQVMTKEKEINHAYFRDHDPISLERLEDVKQLELFI